MNQTGVTIMTEDIPKGWRKVKLGDVCELLKGSGLSKEKLTPNGKHSCILYGELYTVYDEIIKTVKSKTDSEEGIPSKKGDILVPGSTTTIGIDLAKGVALNQDGVLLGGDINILRKIDDSYNSEYLAYYITHIKKYEISKLTQGSTIIHLYGKNLKKIDLLLPPLEFQNKIAEIIKTNDETIYETEKIINECERIKIGLMQTLLTKGIPGKHKKFKKTEIGEIPENWKIKKIFEIADTYAGGTPLRSISTYYEGNIPWVKSGEVNQKLIYDTEERISNDAIKNSSAKLIPKNAILVALYGATAGKIGILKIEGTSNQAVLAVVPKNDSINYQFIYYILSSYTKRILQTTQGSGQPNLSKNIIDSLKITLPELEEQNEIVRILSTVEQRIDDETRKQQQLIKLKLSLMQKLLSGEIRVRV